jgi:hypothetical protein
VERSGHQSCENPTGGVARPGRAAFAIGTRRPTTRSHRFPGLNAPDRIDLKEALVRAYGDTAVLVGKATFVVNGGSIYKLVYTEVYARRNHQWKLVNLHTCSGSF